MTVHNQNPQLYVHGYLVKDKHQKINTSRKPSFKITSTTAT